jgi:hypothetical protein
MIVIASRHAAARVDDGHGVGGGPRRRASRARAMAARRLARSCRGASSRVHRARVAPHDAVEREHEQTDE